MGVEIDILKGFKTTTINRYILYLATIIFVGSLFFQIHGIEPAVVQHQALWIIFWGLLFWPIVELIENRGIYYEDRGETEHALIFLVFWGFIQLIYLLFTILIIIW